MIKKLDTRFALLLTVVAALLVLLVGWFGLISTERSKASSVATQISQKQDQLTAANALVSSTSKAAAETQFKAAEKVLPADPRMSQVVRQISTASTTASVQIDAVLPGAVTTVGAGQAVPITLTIEGQYFAIRQFLALLQAGASMKNDKVVGTGRLYSVDGIQFTQPLQAASGSPSSSQALGSSGLTAPKAKNSITAVINLNVFIAGAPPAPVLTTTTPTDSSSTSSSDTTTTASGATP